MIEPNPKEALINKAQEIAGVLPPGISGVIKLLSHPDVIAQTTEYFKSINPRTMCTLYEAPWNCAREAESRYQSIRYGWLGGMSGIGYDESWCENCRSGVMDTIASGIASGDIDKSVYEAEQKFWETIYPEGHKL